MRATLLLGLVMLLGACRQDPLRLRLFDGGPSHDGAAGDGLPDRAFTDAKLEGLLGDREPISYDACKAIPEGCNGVDDNCNGQIDEGFDKLTDPRYCEECKGCSWMIQKNAFPACQAGKCSISTCAAGYHDLDQKADTGCEYGPCQYSGVEICDGLDNDCNGLVDDGVTLSVNICKDQGPCAGTTATCDGSKGWVCKYDLSKGVELQACTKDEDCGVDAAGKPLNKCDVAAGVCPGIVVNDEKKCDGLDGDCDGLADDPWANQVLPNALGKECDVDATPKLGVCRNLGKYACDPTTKDKVVCQLTKAGVAPGDETCNGLDDNCDGEVDNLDLVKTPSAEQWVSVGGGLKVFVFEASRPDGSASAGGIISDGRPCSVPGRLPWTNVTKEDAQLACQRIGARLCTVTEWQQACKGQAGTEFPYGNTFQPSTCNGRAYDINPATPANEDGPLPTDKPGGSCVSKWGGGDLFNMSGNVKEWVTATGNAWEIRGGAYDTPSIDGFGAGLSCTYSLPVLATSKLQLPSLGFRCCK